MKTKEQKLIDIMFEVALTLTMKKYKEHFSEMPCEQVAAWVADQLRGSGFDTEPVGSSWGLLKRSEF